MHRGRPLNDAVQPLPLSFEVTRGHGSGQSRALLYLSAFVLVLLVALVAREVDGSQNQQQRLQLQLQKQPQQPGLTQTPRTPASGSRPTTERRIAKVEGDIILGALFPVHRQPSINTSFTRQCGEVFMNFTVIDKIRRLFYDFSTISGFR